MTKISNKVESGNILRINTMALSEMARNGIIRDARNYDKGLWDPKTVAEFVGYGGSLDEAGRILLATTLLESINNPAFWDSIGKLPNGLKRVVAVSSVLATYREFTGSAMII